MHALNQQSVIEALTIEPERYLRSTLYKNQIRNFGLTEGIGATVPFDIVITGEGRALIDDNKLELIESHRANYVDWSYNYYRLAETNIDEFPQKA